MERWPSSRFSGKKFYPCQALNAFPSFDADNLAVLRKFFSNNRTSICCHTKVTFSDGLNYFTRRWALPDWSPSETSLLPHMLRWVNKPRMPLRLICKQGYEAICACTEKPGLGRMKGAVQHPLVVCQRMPSQHLDRDYQRICQQVLHALQIFRWFYRTVTYFEMLWHLLCGMDHLAVEKSEPLIKAYLSLESFAIVCWQILWVYDFLADKSRHEQTQGLCLWDAVNAQFLHHCKN